MVPGTWARGHWARKQAADRLKLAPLPGPDVADDELDLGHLDLPEPAAEGNHFYEDGIPSPPPRDPEPEEPAEEARPIGWPPAGGGQRRSQSRVRVTASVRKDIDAKLRLMLMVPGKLWEIRDPLCGGTFMRQEQDIAAALTSIVCDSADLVAFFTGPAGGFMKYLELLTALQPVAMMIWAHHIAHSITLPPQDGQQPQPDMARYAA